MLAAALQYEDMMEMQPVNDQDTEDPYGDAQMARNLQVEMYLNQGKRQLEMPEEKEAPVSNQEAEEQPAVVQEEAAGALDDSCIAKMLHEEEVRARAERFAARKAPAKTEEVKAEAKPSAAAENPVVEQEDSGALNDSYIAKMLHEEEVKARAERFAARKLPPAAKPEAKPSAAAENPLVDPTIKALIAEEVARQLKEKLQDLMAKLI